MGRREKDWEQGSQEETNGEEGKGKEGVGLREESVGRAEGGR